MDAATALNLLRKSAQEIISGECEVGIAYSGGLDSSLVAAIAKDFAKVRCYTCALKGSFDERTVGHRADSESLDLVLVELRTDDLPVLIREVAQVLGTSNPMELAYTIPVFSVLKESQERTILAGNGADELFAGYAKYASVRNPEKLMTADLERMLREGDALKKAATAMGKRIGFPFVSQELIEFARFLPLNRKISSDGRKILLRDVAKLLRLPSQSLPKKAAQYSSGILKEMERQAKASGKSLAEWTRGTSDSRRRSP